ncbi:hypothetical protein ACFS6H_20075 [Terrimonas rubra]|uniref:HNH endonuclease n=1 Tax=Terrimonas rubra TaxID=1035890 RepID=A0ABW6A9V0_9BACT
MKEKYNHIDGTHCWFCDREYSSEYCLTIHTGMRLRRTKEHIIPRSKIGVNISTNYIGSCIDCNHLKGDRNAKQIAERIEKMIEYNNHEMKEYFPIMRLRAWKLYNKTAFLHRNFKTISPKTTKHETLKNSYKFHYSYSK